jgi:hypothetical protein
LGAKGFIIHSMLINKTEQNMSLNTKTYSKLLRETAKQNGVELLNGRWTDGLGPSRRTIGQDRLVTFKINTTTGNFDKFIKELSTMTLLISGKAPRHTTPRKDIETRMAPGGLGYSRERFESDHSFVYLKYNTVAA